MLVNTVVRAPRLAIALLSATALAYEILLTRLFAIVQWHHFSYMVISLALLGYGASGTFLAITGSRWLKYFPYAFSASIILFGASAVGCFLIAQRIPFNPEELFWDRAQPFYLFTTYIVLSIPFFFAASSLALALSYFRNDMSRIYAMDLLGAGMGSLLIIFLLSVAFPATALMVIAAGAMFAAGLAWLEMRQQPTRVAVPIVLVGVVVLFLPGNWISLAISQYKSLPQALHIKGTTVVQQRSSPLGLLSVVESPVVPWRHAPGLSLLADSEPPPQLGVFTDGDAMTAITQYNGDPTTLSYLDHTTSAAPYHLGTAQHVLILGAGGGADVLQALYHHAERIDAVELNPQLVEMLQQDYRRYTLPMLQDKRVTLHVAEARDFVTRRQDRYDVIQVALLDSFNASSAGLYALNESYLYTVEAMRLMLQRLQPDGFLAITRWVKVPPRDTLKLFATAIEALRDLGSTDPAQSLLLIRNWQTSTLIIKNGVISPDEIMSVKRFAEQRAFDLDYFPGADVSLTNRYNILDQSYFFHGATALLSSKHEQFMQDYKFDLRPTSDDRPYFFHFFKWRSFAEIFSLRVKGGMGLMEWGYLIVVATLLQALVASVVLIVLPLWFFHRTPATDHHRGTQLRVLGYFFVIGLAFLFVEMAYIQKFLLFLHHPLYAISVILAGFLVFAGLGSAYSRRFTQADRNRPALRRAVWVIAGVTLVYLFALDPLFSLLAALSIWMKIVVTLILIAPLAFFMGQPFPLGLDRTAKLEPRLVPWAWGVNGCASVLSAVIATLVGVHFGFSAVLLCALALYFAAVGFMPRIQGRYQT